MSNIINRLLDIIKWFHCERQPYGVINRKFIRRGNDGVTHWRKWKAGEKKPRTFKQILKGEKYV
jgi:hypothetical protein